MDQTTQPQVVAQNQTTPPQSVNALSSTTQGLNTFFYAHKKLIMAILVVFGALFLVKTVFFKPAVISVIGTGHLTAKPAQVEMLVTKVDSNPDPVLAILAGEESIINITAKAKELAGESVEIQKSFYQVTPSVVAGDVLYQVVNVFKITAQDPATATGLIKGFYANGATTVSGVNFIPANREKVTQDVRKAAIKDARVQAKDIAKASGKRVGRIISIGDDLSKGNSTISTDGQVDVGASDGSTQLNYAAGAPSEIDVSKSMTVTYEIW